MVVNAVNDNQHICAHIRDVKMSLLDVIIAIFVGVPLGLIWGSIILLSWAIIASDRNATMK